jgi:hypothetical protein
LDISSFVLSFNCLDILKSGIIWRHVGSRGCVKAQNRSRVESGFILFMFFISAFIIVGELFTLRRIDSHFVCVVLVDLSSMVDPNWVKWC